MKCTPIKRKKHDGSPDNCPACKGSTAIKCHYCGHALTGKFDKDGRIRCSFCKKKLWLGVGYYND